MNKRFGRDDLIAAHYTLSDAALAERGRRGLARRRNNRQASRAA